MEQQADFQIVNTWDNKTQFTLGDITITSGMYSCENGKHRIAEPGKANAHFVCGGRLFTFANREHYTTVEEWYFEELLPKLQMLRLLTMADSPVNQPNSQLAGS